jgi:signal peptidase I
LDIATIIGSGPALVNGNGNVLPSWLGVAMTWNQWSENVTTATERFLTWRKRRRLAKKEKQKRKNPVLDWVEAILSAVLIVLVINQYLVQAYQIPSQSMIPALEINDRIFVNKLVYGPELIPGMLKFNGFRQPRRGEVIIFENPSYIPIGPFKDILQRVIYMLTLSLVDIDRDEYGNPKHHFLIKRAIGMGGDRLRMDKGDVELLLPGTGTWMPEKEVDELLGLRYTTRRIFSPEEYPDFENAGIGLALLDARLSLTPEQDRSVNRFYSVTKSDSGEVSWRQTALVDNIFVDKWRYRTLYSLRPYSTLFRSQWRTLEEGWYIPGNRIFPMGDNRDDSRDARFFGPVRLDKVLGKAMFRYWPLTRLGTVR